MPHNEQSCGREKESSASHGRFAKRVAIAIALVAVIALLLSLVTLSIQVWLVLFAGILLAVFLRGIADWVRARTGLPALPALIVTVVLLLGFTGLAGWLMAPNVISQMQELSNHLPQALRELEVRLKEFSWGRYVVGQFPSEAVLLSGESGGLAKLGGFFSGGVEAIAGFMLFLFLGLYLAAAPQVYTRGILRLFPISKRPRVEKILDALGATLRFWLLGQVVSMIVVGVLIGIGLKILGVPMPLALGVLAGLFDFVPIVGPLISAVPAVMLAFLISPWHALYVVALYVFVNTVIESHLLVPLIQRYTVSLPPAITLLALVLMGSVFGFLGILLATPAAASVLVLVRMIYVEDVLGDTASGDKPNESA